MRNTILWIWLQQRLGYASKWAEEIIATPGAPAVFFGKSAEELEAMGFSSGKAAQLANCSLEDAEKIYLAAKSLGQEMITPDSIYYPDSLRCLQAPPLVLYASGKLQLLHHPHKIGMVGTRSCSSVAGSAAQELAFRLCRAGALVVSGAAYGIDSYSHNGALMAHGATIAVLGCGINTNYNKSSENLRELIAVHGVLISEFPPGYPAYGPNFPLRNRIIAGLSQSVTVVAAPRPGGSFITAEEAIVQGKRVFVDSHFVPAQTIAKLDKSVASCLTMFSSADELVTLLEDQLPPRGERDEDMADTTPVLTDIQWEIPFTESGDPDDGPIFDSPPHEPDEPALVTDAIAETAGEVWDFPPDKSRAESDYLSLFYEALGTSGELQPEVTDTLPELAPVVSEAGGSIEPAEDIYEAGGDDSFSEYLAPEESSKSAVPLIAALAADELSEGSYAEITEAATEMAQAAQRAGKVSNVLQTASEQLFAAIASRSREAILEHMAACADLLHQAGESMGQTFGSITGASVNITRSAGQLLSGGKAEGAGRLDDDPLPADLSQLARQLHGMLAEHLETVDGLADRSGQPISLITETLLELEMYGLVDSLPGGRYATTATPYGEPVIPDADHPKD